MRILITQEQRLDQLVYAHYGDLTHFSDVMETNSISITDVYLKVGDEVDLPEYEKKEETNSEIGGLW